MKTILTILAALTLVVGVRAGDLIYPITQAPLVYTNLLVSSNTAGVATSTYTQAVNTAFTKYNTFQFFYTSNQSGTVSAQLESTVDGENWVGKGGVTNTVTTASELQFTGKEYAYRVRVTQGTNSVFKVNHIGE